MKKTRKAFTLVELVIVIAVIAVLAAVLIPTFSGILQRAKKAKSTLEATSVRDDYLTTYLDPTQTVADLANYLIVVDNDVYVLNNRGEVTQITDYTLDQILQGETDSRFDYTLDDSVTLFNNAQIYIAVEKTTASPGLYLSSNQTLNPDYNWNYLTTGDEAVFAVSEGTLTIVDEDFTNLPDEEYSIRLDDSITALGENVFKNNTHLTTITFNTPLETIGDSAFLGCTAFGTIEELSALTSVADSVFEGTAIATISIPLVTEIGDDSFKNCTNLVTIEAPLVTTLGDYALYGCENLTAFDLTDISAIGTRSFPDSENFAEINLTEISSVPEMAFLNYTNLTSFQANNVETVGARAFEGCSYLLTLTLPDITSTSSRMCYNDLRLTSVTCPDITTIAEYTFYSCSQLASVDFQSVETIETYAFYGTAITIASFPLVTSIGSSAFYSCLSLASANFPLVTSIGGSAFKNCSSLATISFAALQSLSNSSVFYGCNLLTEINATQFPSLTTFNTSALGSGSYSRVETINLPGVTSLTNTNLSGLSYLRNLTLGITSINSATNKIQSNYITTLSLPSLTTVTSTQAINSTSVTTVTLASMVNSEMSSGLRYGTFYNCTHLETINLPSATSIRYLSANGNSNYRLPALTTLNIPLITSITADLNYTLSGAANIVTINAESLTNIGTNAFSNKPNFRTITLDHIQTIGETPFNNCPNMFYNQSLTFPNTLTQIGQRAFSGLFIRSVSLPTSLTSLGMGAFMGCYGINSVTANCPNLTNVGDNVFAGCTSIYEFNIGSSSSRLKTSTDRELYFDYSGQQRLLIYSDNISGYSNTHTYTVPSVIDAIDTNAFYGCTMLQDVTIPSSVTSIGGSNYDFTSIYNFSSNPFYTCSSLQNIYMSSNSYLKTYTNKELVMVDNYFGSEQIISVARTFSGEYTVPENVTQIGSYSFAYSGITSLVSHANVTYISDNSFLGCNNLSNIELQNTSDNLYVSESAFNYDYGSYYYKPDYIQINNKHTTITINTHFNTEALLNVKNAREPYGAYNDQYLTQSTTYVEIVDSYVAPSNNGGGGDTPTALESGIYFNYKSHSYYYSWDEITSGDKKIVKVENGAMNDSRVLLGIDETNLKIKIEDSLHTLTGDEYNELFGSMTSYGTWPLSNSYTFDGQYITYKYTLVIDEEVTEINISSSTMSGYGMNIVGAYSGIKSVVIPGTVNYIGEYSFTNCPYLTEIEFKHSDASGLSIMPAYQATGGAFYVDAYSIPASSLITTVYESIGGSNKIRSYDWASMNRSVTFADPASSSSSSGTSMSSMNAGVYFTGTINSHEYSTFISFSDFANLTSSPFFTWDGTGGKSIGMNGGSSMAMDYLYRAISDKIFTENSSDFGSVDSSYFYNNTFSQCKTTGTMDVVFGSDIQYISEVFSSFDTYFYAGPTRVFIPSSVTGISDKAFTMCHNLTYIEFGHSDSDSINIIGGAFYADSYLYSTNKLETTVVTTNQTVQNYIWSDENRDVTFVAPGSSSGSDSDSMASMAAGAYFSETINNIDVEVFVPFNDFLGYCVEMTNPFVVTTHPSYSGNALFMSDSSLQDPNRILYRKISDVVYSNYNSSFNSYANAESFFNNCFSQNMSNYTYDFVISDSVQSIGYFKNTSGNFGGIARLYIPSSVSNIYTYAFTEHSNLTYIEFGHSASDNITFQGGTSDRPFYVYLPGYQYLDTTIVTANSTIANHSWDGAYRNATVTAPGASSNSSSGSGLGSMAAGAYFNDYVGGTEVEAFVSFDNLVNFATNPLTTYTDTYSGLKTVQMNGDPTMSVYTIYRLLSDVVYDNYPQLRGTYNTYYDFYDHVFSVNLLSYTYKMVIGDSIQAISGPFLQGGSASFGGLSAVYIPSSVQSISEESFQYNKNLTTIEFGHSASDTISISAGTSWGAFYNNSGSILNTVVYTSNQTVKDYNWSAQQRDVTFTETSSSGSSSGSGMSTMAPGVYFEAQILGPTVEAFVSWDDLAEYYDDYYSERAIGTDSMWVDANTQINNAAYANIRAIYRKIAKTVYEENTGFQYQTFTDFWNYTFYNGGNSGSIINNATFDIVVKSGVGGLHDFCNNSQYHYAGVEKVFIPSSVAMVGTFSFCDNYNLDYIEFGHSDSDSYSFYSGTSDTAFYHNSSNTIATTVATNNSTIRNYTWSTSTRRDVTFAVPSSSSSASQVNQGRVSTLNYWDSMNMQNIEYTMTWRELLANDIVIVDGSTLVGINTQNFKKAVEQENNVTLNENDIKIDLNIDDSINAVKIRSGYYSPLMYESLFDPNSLPPYYNSNTSQYVYGVEKLLYSVTFPSTVEFIGEHSFYNNLGIGKLIFEHATTDAIYINPNAFYSAQYDCYHYQAYVTIQTNGYVTNVINYSWGNDNISPQFNTGN